MLAWNIYFGVYFNDVDAALIAFRNSRCGTTEPAVDFEERLAVFSTWFLTPAKAVWMAWQECTLEEAQQRSRELH